MYYLRDECKECKDGVKGDSTDRKKESAKIVSKECKDGFIFVKNPSKKIAKRERKKSVKAV